MLETRVLSGPQWHMDGACRTSVGVRNDGSVPTSETIQVYLHDPMAEVARPV